MLTEEGHKARFWGAFSALRHVLETKSIPDHYYGPTSASDNMFEAVSRHLQLAILVQAHEGELVEAATSDPELGRSLVSDLEGVRATLQGVSRHFADQDDLVERVTRDVYRAAATSHDTGHPKHSP